MDDIETIENREAIANTTRKTSTTQVLIVLSDNGVEEIPFTPVNQKSGQQVNDTDVSLLNFLYAAQKLQYRPYTYTSVETFHVIFPYPFSVRLFSRK